MKTYTGTIVFEKSGEITKNTTRETSREDIQHIVFQAGPRASFRGTDNDGECWVYDEYDGWQNWTNVGLPKPGVKAPLDMKLSELSQKLQKKQGKLSIVRSRGLWVMSIGKNEFKGSTFMETVSKAVWDA